MREQKGRRLSEFRNDYIVIDLETTDRNINYAEIIEIGAIKVIAGEVVSTFSTLVKPEFEIPASATAINGITNEMVKDAPSIKDVIIPFIEFVGDSVLLGHNITTFDINILYDCLESIYGIPLTNDFIDTLYVSRSVCLDLCNHKLGTISQFFELNIEGEHRALYDCYLTHYCYMALRDKAEREGISLNRVRNNSQKRQRRKQEFSDETRALQELQGFLKGITADGVVSQEEFWALKGWMEDHIQLAGNYPFDVVMATLDKVLEDGTIERAELDELMTLYQKFTAPVEAAEHEVISSLEGVHCCVTGDFNYGERSEVKRFIESHGGICDDNVKKATQYVIVGSNGSDAWKHGNYGGKIKRAMELQEKGVTVNIISEEDFFKEIGE